MKRLLFALLLAVLSASASAQTDCAVNPQACQAAPVPSTCPTGQHWTTMGSGIAHCVANDPVCTSGYTLTHDALGNPSCKPTTTTSWEYQQDSCPNNYDGTATYRRQVTTTGTTVTYGTWSLYDDSGCTAPVTSSPSPTPACSNGATDYPTCTPPASSGTCSNGATDYPTCTPPASSGTCSNGATDYPTCTPPTSSVTCSNGATDYPTCTPPASSGTCSNGATDYPTCTPPTCANGATNYPTCTLAATTPTCPAPDTNLSELRDLGWDNQYDCYMVDTTYSVSGGQCVAANSGAYQTSRITPGGICEGNYANRDWYNNRVQ